VVPVQSYADRRSRHRLLKRVPLPETSREQIARGHETRESPLRGEPPGFRWSAGTAANGATSPLAAASAKVGSPPSRTFKSDTTLSEIWVRVVRTLAPRRERGKLGQGRARESPSSAQRCLDALDRDGAEPRHQQRGNTDDGRRARRNFGRIVLLSGSAGR